MTDALRALALAHLKGALEPNKNFPLFVFRHCWDEYFFFDCARIFEPAFIPIFKGLLDAESGVCICICNLDLAGEERMYRNASIFLNRSTDAEAYKTLLGVGDVRAGWRYRMENFASISDTGCWCLYWESQAEIAVIGIRGKGMREDFMTVIRRLGALPIREALEQQLTYTLSAAAKPSWRETLRREYGFQRPFLK